VSPAARLAVALTAVQALGALAWVVYAALLSGLLAAAGVDPAWRPWILLADQMIFALGDALAGVWLDRAAAATRRLGPPLLRATAVASAAFLALPWLADAPGLLLAAVLLVLWWVRGRPRLRVNSSGWGMRLALAFLAAFWVLRNLPGWDWLSPV
jgi:hypothetical protein